jgi:hypothetical protein
MEGHQSLRIERVAVKVLGAQVSLGERKRMRAGTPAVPITDSGE